MHVWYGMVWSRAMGIQHEDARNTTGNTYISSLGTIIQNLSYMPHAHTHTTDTIDKEIHITHTHTHIPSLLQPRNYLLRIETGKGLVDGGGIAVREMNFWLMIFIVFVYLLALLHQRAGGDMTFPAFIVYM